MSSGLWGYGTIMSRIFIKLKDIGYLMAFLAKLQKFEEALKASRGPAMQGDRLVYDFAARKADYQQHLVKTALAQVSTAAWSLAQSSKGQERAVVDILRLMLDLEERISDRDAVLHLVEQIKRRAEKLRVPSSRPIPLDVRAPRLPPEIDATIAADFDEIQRCFASGCYRSVTILCGRVLEAALHRKYYDVTGIDILEKNPGIGLGNLIAKLHDKNVELDPGLTQQIHLINQVRIFSVHTKQTAFNPSQAQAHAMVLYTIDTLEKIF